MLTDICQEIRNWFDRGLPKHYGEFNIVNGNIEELSLVEGQYFRIIGSLFNDGVHKVGDTLTDEKFNGSVWEMAIPLAVVQLSAEIDEWTEKNKDAIASPYTSESFGGYSYSKATGSNGSLLTWIDAFKTRLNAWRKI
jgi:hypothetical protein